MASVTWRQAPRPTDAYELRALLLLGQRREQRAAAIWQPVLASAMQDAPAALPRLARRDLFGFLVLWNHLHEAVLGEAKERLNAVALQLGVPARARRMLAHGNLSDRLLAVATLGQLRDHSVRDRLCDLAAGPSVILSLTAARALVQIDRAAAVGYLIPLVAARPDWPPGRVIHVLRAAGADAISEPLARAALEAAPEHAPRLIRYLEVVHCETLVPTVRQIIHRTGDAEVIAACLRVFRDPDDLETVRRFLDDPR